MYAIPAIIRQPRLLGARVACGGAEGDTAADHYPMQRLQKETRPAKKGGRALAEQDGQPPKKKLTKEEQEELEEKELEEACEKWCGKGIRIITVGSMLWGLLTPVYEWAFRPPVLLQPVDLTGRTYVLTGGTDGLGKEAALRLALDGARVVIGARNVSKAEAMMSELRSVNPSLDLEVRYLDLANLSSVVEFATSFTGEVTDEEDGSGAIAGLLNNAASLEDACTPTMDGFETATQVNYLAPTLLTKLLLPQLEQSGASRIVHVSCPAAEKAQLKLEHLETVPAVLDDQSASGIGGSCDVFQRYATAKLLTVAFSTRLASELSTPRSNLGLSVFPVTTNVYDPVSQPVSQSASQPPRLSRHDQRVRPGTSPPPRPPPRPRPCFVPLVSPARRWLSTRSLRRTSPPSRLGGE